ncbi:hypothetical protein Bca52824_073880 [Brassica carinata]|uniref:DUF4283 domain-containing protein n=1 Tax=Brassica carinata TaxID=52824 RepID=A0A8X7QAR3_BRACI|nr:hypothetical protein Bca52824_073880 [Brassica carinata]
MADGIRRAMQDIDLGVNDAPVAMPAEMVRQAAEENRFIIVGRPVMPRRQNLRAIIATMPRNWGLEGIVRGRITEGRRFQFVFPSEEAMETVLRRGPWAYAERILVLQRWTPLMDMEMMNYIPLWVQIRGIPLQFMNREVILYIARIMGQYIQMEYNEETGGRLEFVRVRLNWNINRPLRFQRNFQFAAGINTLLKFQYERLQGFCEVCGLLTHDTGACVINNGGGAPDAGDDDSGDDQDEEVVVPNHGVIIEEVQEEAAEQEEEIEDMEADADDADLWNGHARPTMFSEELTTNEEMYNPIDPFGLRAAAATEGKEVDHGTKRKVWMEEANGNKAKFTKRERGETSGAAGNQKMRETTPQSDEEADGQNAHMTEQRGALGFLSHVLVPPVGLGGGLVIFFKQHVQLSVLSQSPNLIDCNVICNENQFYFSFVYGHPNHAYRHHTWEKLNRIGTTRRSQAWFALGDFNDILGNHEKDGGRTRPEASFQNFRCMMRTCGFEDLQSVGDRLSWVGQRGNHLVRCCLDRTMANNAWYDQFPASHTEYLEIGESDHRPMVTFISAEREEPRRFFRFDSRMINKEGFRDTVSRGWKGMGQAQLIRVPLTQRMRYIIGDGSYTDMWKDSWLPLHPPRPPRSREEVCDNTKVQSYMKEGSQEWNLEKLRSEVVDEDYNTIVALKISSKAHQDLYGWHYNEDGIYTKNMHWKIVLRYAKDDAQEWKGIDFKDGRGRATTVRRNQECEDIRRWSLPTNGRIKCNVDGSFRNENTEATAGWLYRDEEGQYKGSAQRNQRGDSLSRYAFGYKDKLHSKKKNSIMGDKHKIPCICFHLLNSELIYC